MIRLDLWLTLPTGEKLHAAELVFGDADRQGRYASAFRYTAEYLADARAFALDPAALPLAPGDFQGQQLDIPLLALEDALPDDWGRRLLILRHGLPRGRQSEPHLLHVLAGQGLGALGFYPPGQPPGEEAYAAAMLELDTLLDAAQRLERDGNAAIDDTSRSLLAAGSSPGGARPKALVYDDSGQWIAKFPSRRDDVDMVGLEATSLELARQAGLEVPDFRLVELSDGLASTRRALLVKRFDLIPQGGRRHMLSFRALLQASGYYVIRYADLIAALRQHGACPEEDVPRLYRQMVFNALLGNTDDHLKNFWLLHDAAGYRLSPAFDLLPDTGARREHVLLFDLTPLPPSPVELAALGRKWGVSGAAAICQEVEAAVARFAEIAADKHVPATEINRFTQDIARRCRTER
ncbi:MAG: HipA domain-containing protein [Pseudomonadota bacterium]|nr:HipA domain-containing protein [Pseudomonadota bacterium]